MEENQPQTGNFAWKYGALAGGAIVVFSLMLYSMDLIYEQNIAMSVIPFALAAIAIVLAIVQFKKGSLGFLTLSEALKIGTGIGVVAAIIASLYLLALTNIIEPDYWDKMFEAQRATVMAKNPQITPEQMDQGIEMQKKFAWLGYPIGLIMYALFGLIVGLITGLILKKQKPAY